jgi:hypothetical protein
VEHRTPSQFSLFYYLFDFKRHQYSEIISASKISFSVLCCLSSVSPSSLYAARKDDTNSGNAVGCTATYPLSNIIFICPSILRFSDALNSLGCTIPSIDSICLGFLNPCLRARSSSFSYSRSRPIAARRLCMNPASTRINKDWEAVRAADILVKKAILPHYIQATINHCLIVWSIMLFG